MPRRTALPTLPGILAAGAFAAAVALVAAGAWAQQRGPQALPPATPQAALPDSVKPVTLPADHDPATQFNSTERWLIPRYFELLRDRQRRAGRSKIYARALPAGLTVMPGIGDTLPATVMAQMEPLPGPLLRELPPRRPDTQRYVAGQNVLLIQLSSGRVLDTLDRVIY